MMSVPLLVWSVVVGGEARQTCIQRNGAKNVGVYSVDHSGPHLW